MCKRSGNHLGWVCCPLSVSEDGSKRFPCCRDAVRTVSLEHLSSNYYDFSKNLLGRWYPKVEKLPGFGPLQNSTHEKWDPFSAAPHVRLDPPAPSPRFHCKLLVWNGLRRSEDGVLQWYSTKYRFSTTNLETIDLVSENNEVLTKNKKE